MATAAPRLIPAGVFLQEACAKHRYIRTNDNSGIYERPERLRAAHIGIAAAYARIECAQEDASNSNSTTVTPRQHPLEIIKSAAKVDFNHTAVQYVHAVDEGLYLTNLTNWAEESSTKIAAGSSEIPEVLKELEDDLYLCPQSLEAFQGGLGTICEAVDTVVTASRPGSDSSQADSSSSMSKRAFVVIRPPGHHCGEDNPNGFCFVNDVAVGAAHAYTEHNIRYAVIFDIDLHHGNGTQAITWEINHDTHMDQAGMRIFYGSIHDILSYPCEEGKADAIKDASISIGGQYGQWIENIHLRPYRSDEQFWLDYETLYSKIFEKAAAFVEDAAKGEEVMVFLSCGFDASEYESDAMSRHGSKVPTTFYHRFTRDACKFADRFSNGRIVSVMEGGYSDRALTSGAMAHVCGLVDSDGGKFNVDPDWWSFENLLMLEKYTQKRKGRPARTTFLAPWLQRTLDILPLFSGAPSTSQVLIPPSRKRDPPPTKTGRPRGRPRKHPLPLAGSSSISSTTTTTTTTTSSKGPKRTLPERQAAASSKRRRLDITARAQDAPDSTTGQQAIGQSTQPSVVGGPIEQGEAQTAGLESVASTSSVPRDLRLAFAEEIRKLKKLEENIAAFQVAYRPDLQNPHINWVRTQRLKEVLQSWEMDGLT